MTFTEAAEAVLRKVGKPLHYKKITQFAIEQNLLSHVGKTPEVTMSTRLATLAKKDRGEAPIVRVKPGVFGLRDWGDAAVAAAADEPEGEEVTEGEGDTAEDEAEQAAAEAAVVRSPEEQERAQRLVAASQLFPEEADDNEPVFAEKPPPAPPPAANAGANAGAAPNGPPREGEGDGVRRRRRRRRRGRGSERDVAGAPVVEGQAPEASDGFEGDEAGDDLLPDEDGFAGEEGAEPGPARETGMYPAGEEGGEPRPEPRRDGREPREGRGDGGRGEGGRDNRESRESREAREGREAREPTRFEETGRDAADLVVSMLNRRDDRQAVPFRALVDEAIRQGKMAGDTNILAAALSAAARADSGRREARGERPRLRVSSGRVALVDWLLGPELVRAEADALAALERLREASRRQVIRRLNELPQAALIEVLVMLLERLGITQLRNTRRPGLPQGEVHLSGVARRSGEELRVAVLLKRGGEIGRERVIELRGSLHHYANAQAAWVLTTGNVLSGAREEATQSGVTPVTLIDGPGLGRFMDEHVVGVRHAMVPVPYLDLDLFDALRNV